MPRPKGSKSKPKAAPGQASITLHNRGQIRTKEVAAQGHSRSAGARINYENGNGRKLMKPLAELVFIGEIAFQAKIAQRSAEVLSATQNHSDHIEVWRSIQSLLVAAGNISKILWPPWKQNVARGQELRKILDVDRGNLLSNRKFRDHFEHYDERIEKWIEESPSAVYLDPAIDPFPWIWGPQLETRHRVYNPVTRTLTFRGESINLAEVMEAIEEVRQKCGRFVLT